jgi:hypothetical protein
MSPEVSLLATAQHLAKAERNGDVYSLQEILAVDYAGYDPAGPVPARFHGGPAAG